MLLEVLGEEFNGVLGCDDFSTYRKYIRDCDVLEVHAGDCDVLVQFCMAHLIRDERIGRFDHELLPPRPRSRRAYDTPKWTGYEVMLDVFPDVIAYGILLMPKDIAPGERRPVVVCQHGLEGRPQRVVTGDSPSYHDFAARLAERGADR